MDAPGTLQHMIVRMIENKIAPLSVPNSSKLRYDADIKTIKDCIQKLAQNPAFLTAFKCVPTRYGPWQKRNKVFGIISRFSDFYAKGNIRGDYLKRLVWNYR